MTTKHDNKQTKHGNKQNITANKNFKHGNKQKDNKTGQQSMTTNKT